VPDRRSAIDFGLTDRALRFAQNYAACPSWGVTLCAKKAGYSDLGRAAHVRGCELLRDPRVIRAIVHYSGLALAEAQAEATMRLRLLADGGKVLAWRDRTMIENLAIDLAELARRADRLDKVFAASVEKAA
jgi:phage terminase small subunit